MDGVTTPTPAPHLPAALGPAAAALSAQAPAAALGPAGPAPLPPTEARFRALEEQLKETQLKLESVTSTMEAQQRLVHDTLSRYMSIKSELEAKEYDFEERLRKANEDVLAKDDEIRSLERQLKETMRQLDRVNAYVANNVVEQAAVRAQPAQAPPQAQTQAIAAAVATPTAPAMAASLYAPGLAGNHRRSGCR
nr:hypothetical protein HK105_007127 [Polyrhizophydium stewartii]